MSTATEKRQHSQALADAEAFKLLFPSTTYERWTFAGSLRRGKSEVGDVEHVVLPAFGVIENGGDLFGVKALEPINLLMHHLDALLSSREVTKHLYGSTATGAPLYRWGMKYRGVGFRGFNHEVFCADAVNWGSQLVIRTGPAEFSQAAVTALRRHGRRHKDGYVMSCVPCPACGQDRVDANCKLCDGTNLQPVARLIMQDEDAFLRLCGMDWVEPRDRR